MPGSERLVGRWTHSHEEDTGEETVFRPASHPFPPARGRTSVDLRPDNTYVELEPGPVDAPAAVSGTWALTGDELTLGAAGDRPERIWRIVAASAERLTVRR